MKTGFGSTECEMFAGAPGKDVFPIEIQVYTGDKKVTIYVCVCMAESAARKRAIKGGVTSKEWIGLEVVDRTWSTNKRKKLRVSTEP